MDIKTIMKYHCIHQNLKKTNKQEQKKDPVQPTLKKQKEKENKNKRKKPAIITTTLYYIGPGQHKQRELKA